MTAVKRPQSIRWSDLPVEPVLPGVTRQRFDGQGMTAVRYRYEPGAHFPAHSHPEEQLVLVLRGKIDFTVAGVPVRAATGSVLLIPPFTVHSAKVVGDSLVETINVLSPRRAKAIEFASPKASPQASRQTTQG